MFEKQLDLQKINLTLAVLQRRVIDSGHAIRFNKNFYRTVNKNGIPVFWGKGTKCMVIESFDKQLYATIENNIFALEQIPETQAYSANFDEIAAHTRDFSHELAAKEQLKFELTYVNMYIKSEST